MQDCVIDGGVVPRCGHELEEQECERLMSSFAKKLGFDHCLYQAHVYPPMTRPAVIQTGNAPREWLEAYAGQDFAVQDPWIRHAQGSSSPWLWAAAGQQTPILFWRTALSCGMHYGCTLPARTEHGIIGAMTFARTHGGVSLGEFDEKAAELAGFCQRLHDGVLKRRLPQLFHRPDSRLSERERTILQWTADGKTSSEIAMILGLTKRTVNFHVAKATMKLNSTNKTQAVLKAAVLGMLF